MPSLFDRVPGDVLAPLAGENRVRMWELLDSLYGQFFGPDGIVSPDDGHSHRSVVAAIEQHLLDHPDWVVDGEPGATPLNVRANMVMDRLIKSGWLREERVGVRNFISMRPALGRFFEHLLAYAQHGPADVGGKIQLIHFALKGALEDPERNAPGFMEASKQARALIAHLNHTHIRVREVMADLSTETSTAEFVQGFFENYVSKLLITDYRTLHTTDHPLRHRDEILRLVSDLKNTPALREKLRKGLGAQGQVRTENIDADLSKAFDQLDRLEDIQRYLERLDRGVMRASRQAVAWLTYSLRSQDRMERVLTQAAEAVRRSGDDEIEVPWSATQPFHESSLRTPSVPRPPVPRTPINERPQTSYEIAMANLMRAMRQTREVTEQEVRWFLGEQLGDRKHLTSDQIKVDSIKDLVMLVALTRVAFHWHGLPARAKPNYVLARRLVDCKFVLHEGQVSENKYLILPRFSVEMVKQ